MTHLLGEHCSPEQRVIAAYLNLETAKLAALVAKVQSAIERLQEYNSTLILEHVWVVYPGKLRYPLTEMITALPLREIHQIALKLYA